MCGWAFFFYTMERLRCEQLFGGPACDATGPFSGLHQGHGTDFAVCWNLRFATWKRVPRAVRLPSRVILVVWKGKVLWITPILQFDSRQLTTSDSSHWDLCWWRNSGSGHRGGWLRMDLRSASDFTWNWFSRECNLWVYTWLIFISNRKMTKWWDRLADLLSPELKNKYKH